MWGLPCAIFMLWCGSRKHIHTYGLTHDDIYYSRCSRWKNFFGIFDFFSLFFFLWILSCLYYNNTFDYRREQILPIIEFMDRRSYFSSHFFVFFRYMRLDFSPSIFLQLVVFRQNMKWSKAITFRNKVQLSYFDYLRIPKKGDEAFVFSHDIFHFHVLTPLMTVPSSVIFSCNSKRIIIIIEMAEEIEYATNEISNVSVWHHRNLGSKFP